MKRLGERLVDRVLALAAAAARRGMMPLRALSAAAILLCLIGAWSVVHNPITTSHVRAGAAISNSQNGTTQDTKSADETSGIQPISALSPSFVTMSLSRSGSTIFALGHAACASSDDSLCPVLARSVDGGKTWRQIHAFPHADSTALGGRSDPSVQPARALSHVLFISRRIGYVYGSDLWVTRDGGESFTKIQHSNASVVGLTQWEGKPIVLSAQGCIQGVCTGRLAISRLASSGTTLGAPIATVNPAAPYASAVMVTSGAQLVVTTTGSAGSGDEPGSWSLVRSGLARIAAPKGCNGTPFVTVAGRGDGKGFLALCDAALSPNTTTYSPLASKDGVTWVSVGSGNLTLPTQGHVSMATSDGTHIVATSGGPRSAPDGTTRQQSTCAIQASINGGKSWSTPTHCGATSPGGFDDVAFWGSNEFVAVAGTTSDYWHSSAINREWIRTKIVGHDD